MGNNQTAPCNGSTVIRRYTPPISESESDSDSKQTLKIKNIRLRLEVLSTKTENHRLCTRLLHEVGQLRVENLRLRARLERNKVSPDSKSEESTSS